jgi:hypothetical protein
MPAVWTVMKVIARSYIHFTDTPQLYNFNNQSNETFETRAKFSLAGIKLQRREFGVLLGDDTGGWTVTLWPLVFQCVGVCASSAHPLVYTYVLTTVTRNFDLPIIQLTPDLTQRK